MSRGNPSACLADQVLKLISHPCTLGRQLRHLIAYLLRRCFSIRIIIRLEAVGMDGACSRQRGSDFVRLVASTGG